MLLVEAYMRRLALEEGCMREWDPEKEELCWDSVPAAPAMEIREKREQTGTGSDNSRKDNKGEGFSCECILRKGPPPSTAVGQILGRHLELIYCKLANQIKLS